MKIGNLEELAEESTSHTTLIKKKVILRNGEVAHVTQFAQAKFPDESIAHEHSHKDMYEIFLVDDGEGEVRVNGKPYSLRKGSYLVVEPGEKHEFRGLNSLSLTYFGVTVA